MKRLIMTLCAAMCAASFGARARAAEPFDWSVPRPEGSPRQGVYYEPDERARLFPAPQWQPDFSGVDKSRIRPVPPAGVHPRIYITPGDLPELRGRIETSQAAGVAWKKLLDETEGFAQDQAVQNLLDGSATVEDYSGKGLMGLRGTVTRQLALNGLRALVEQDQARGKMVAQALAAYADIQWRRMEGGNDVFIGAYRPVHYLALAYDFGAPFMTDQQRATVRRTIARGLTAPVRYLDGAVYGVGHMRPSHNWISLVSQHVMILAMSIEGEPTGIDGLAGDYALQAQKSIADSVERWIHYWWGDNGCSYEGAGKNQFFLAHYIALARRGNWLICHPHVRLAMERFYPAVLQPWGYEMTSHSGWGGGHNPVVRTDAVPMKYFLPDDPAIDFLYRNAVGDDYQHLDSLDVLFAVDWTGPKDWTEHARSADIALDYFDAGRAMMTSRSGWDKQATWFQFVCDQQVTAHMQHEIGNFVLSSHGRVWAQFIHANDSVIPARYHSLVQVDNVEQNGLGRMIAQGDSAKAHFATADYAPAYNLYVESPTKKPSINDYRPMAPISAPFAEMRDSMDWRNPWVKHPVDSDWRAEPIYEVRHAYRTAGLVRGKHPFALVIDDIRKDDQRRKYDWLMQVEEDVVVASMPSDLKGSQGDVILASRDDVTGEGFRGNKNIRKGARCLLVRVLDINRDSGKHVSIVPGTLETWPNVPRWPNVPTKPLGKRLRIQTWADSPDFKVLLYPFEMGEKLPETLWDPKAQRLSVSWSDQSDVFEFEHQPGEPAKFVLKHQEDGEQADTLKFAPADRR